MRRKNKIIFLTSLFLFLLSLSGANSQEVSTEKINNFDVDIRVNQDSSLTVIESIVYDFGSNSRHGIYRTIPVKYQRDGVNYNFRLKVIEVTDDEGGFYNYTAKRSGKNVVIKIGDPNVYVSGSKLYKIKYQVERALNYFNDQDELYWNVTGNEWQVEIKEASARVGLSSYIEPAKMKHTCYTGAFGSSEQNCFSQTVTGGVVNYGLTKPLGAGQGLTIVLGFPRGLVIKPVSPQKIIWFFRDNWFFFLPFITLIVLFSLWYERGRDPKARGTIIPQYGPPDDLTAGEIGTIIDEKLNPRDITATIISLAVRGYLKIQEIKIKTLIFKSKNWKLIKLKEPMNSTEWYEQKIMTAIFTDKKEKLLSKMKENFLKKLPQIKTSIYSSLVGKKYFTTNPDKVKKLYFGLGLALIIICLFGISFFSPIFNLDPFIFIPLFISGLIVMAFSPFMPRKTARGALAHEQILGFKMYLEVAEKDRIKFHNAPEKRPETFEKFLPYAIALGVEKEWAKQFKDIYINPPSWYEGNYVGSFSAVSFINSLSNFSSQASHSAFSSAGSGGSGFGGGGSGGGGGGGGGGSW